MVETGRSTAARNLQQQVQSLVEQFSVLSRAAQARIVEPLSRGELPDRETVDSIRAAMEEAQTVFSDALKAGLAEQRALNLRELLERLKRIIENETWTAIQEECRPDAEHVLRIVHKSGQTPPFLQELHSRARQCIEELSLPTPPATTTQEAWEQKVRPFRDLWLLLNEPDALNEQQAEEILERLERVFGRSLVSAITLHRLMIKPDTVPPCPGGKADQVGGAGMPIVPPPVASPESAVSVIPLTDAQTPDVLESSPSERDTGGPPPPGQSDGNEGVVTPIPKFELPETVTPPPAPPPSTIIAPEPEVVSEPTLSSPTQGIATERKPSLDPKRCSEIRKLIWRLIANNRMGLAYQIGRCAESLGPQEQLESSALLRAAVLGPAVRSSSGEVVEHLRKSIGDVQIWLPHLQDSDEHAQAVHLLMLGLSLRPTLLAPGSGALSLLQAIPALDSLSSALSEIHRAIARFGSFNLELSPTVLKGVRDHAIWQQQLDDLRAEARDWLDSNRQASIIYAPTTEVWHRWLQRDRPLGGALEIIINQQVSRVEEVRQVVGHWSDQKRVEKELSRTDEEIRKGGARRRPIEARARTAICSRVQECVQVAQRWLDLLAAEPQSLDDFRQQRADHCRSEVQRFLPAALAHVDRLTCEGGISTALRGGFRFVHLALEDLGQLFDARRQEVGQALPVRILLGEELLALPDVSLDEDWQPVSDDPETLLRRLEEAAAVPYNPESAFAKQSEARNHLGTQRVIEALATRPDGQELAERLREQREEAVRQCRRALRQKLEETRQSIEQAVCYDLITDEERARFLRTVEDCRLLLEEVFDFASEHRRLEDIDRLITEKRQQRVREVQQKLKETIVPPDRQADLDVVRRALDRGDFLSADEYLELVRSGQPLDRAAEAARVVFRDFFPTFVQRFNSFMEGDGRNRPEIREVVERVREGRSIGPIDMRGVPGPQAVEAAEKMITAWLRLKNRSGDVVKDLTTLLTAFGFRDVQVQLDTALRSPHWSAVCQCMPLGDPNVCIIPYFGSHAKGQYTILGLFERPDEEAIVNLVRDTGRAQPVVVLYFGRMTEQRRRDLAELCWQRRRSFLTIDEALVFFLCGERFSRLPVLFQCALPFTVAEPYTTTASLVPVEMFFGREQERRAILDPYGTNLVYGGRQLGKTALLRDVERREHNPTRGCIVRWIDLKNCGIGIDRPAADLWAVLGQVLHEEKILPRLATTYQTVVDRIKGWLKDREGQRIVLLLDEADAFLEADSRAVSEQTRHSFPEVSRLKGLMDDTDRRFKVVFAGLHNVQRAARDPNTPVAHLGTPVCIGPLLDNGEWRQARDLIEIPFRHMGYVFQPPDLWMRILSYTNYYPSLIQVFCKHLLEYLNNRDRTTFDFRTCPPYPINTQHVENVYQSADLQSEIRHKFELTLGLDDRYRLIALCIALASIEQREERALVNGFDVAWVRDQALSWWPAGFAQDTSYELFRTVLDEMIGLGILRRTSPDRYALRSPNVLNLLGSKSQIEQKLLDVARLPPPLPSYEAASFRRSLHADCWTRSPLTAEQEASLIERSNGVVILYGSPLSGFNDLRTALTVIPSQREVQFLEAVKQLRQFAEWLREVDKRRSESEGVTLAVVMPQACWSHAWVSAAYNFIRKKTSSTKRFVRVVFVADSSIAWEWFEDYVRHDLGLMELSLKPWREAALRRWMEDAEFGPEAVNNCKEILEQTGGWAMLVHALGEACRGCAHNWREQLGKIAQSWPTDPRWAGCCGLPPAALPVLKTMAEWNGPLGPEELSELKPDSDVRRVLRWADRLSYVREVEPDRWILDPHVRSAVMAQG